MAECIVEDCRRTDIVGHGLCAADYQARNKSGLAGVGAEEVARRRAFAEQRLAGCPLEQWLARRRPVTKPGGGGGNVRTYCSCRCHAAKPLSGSARRRAA